MKLLAIGCLSAFVLSVFAISMCAYKVGQIDSTPRASASPAGGSATMATIQCRNYMKENLRSPSTAEFPGMLSGSRASELGENRYLLSEWVDAQNALGATIRSNYQCTISYKGSGRDADRRNWTLEKLVVDGKQVR